MFEEGKTVITQGSIWILPSEFLEWKECICESGTFGRKDMHEWKHIFSSGCCFHLDFGISRIQKKVANASHTSNGSGISRKSDEPRALSPIPQLWHALE
jgi:hypothetical protein